MSFQPKLISSFQAGKIINVKPFLLIDGAFQRLFNAYAWRATVKKREGIKLVGRLRRCFTSLVTLSTQANGASYNNSDILNDASFALRATEPNASIEQGSIEITVGNLNFIDNSCGILVQTGDITNITQANPAEVTSANHTLQTGNIINISGVTGMTEINDTDLNPYTITVTGANTFTLDGIDSTGFTPYIGPTGTWIATDATSPNIGNINYNSGELNLSFDPVIGGATNVGILFCYFPALPVMGIDLRELDTINIEQSVFFDTKYVYTYDDNDFSSPSITTWSGSNSDFFWMANFRGSEASTRLFFSTNGASPIIDTDNRIRYTSDASTWTDFTPAIAGTQVTASNLGALTTTTTFVGNLGNTLIIPGSVTITVTDGAGVISEVRLKDVLGIYPAGTFTGFPSTNSGTIDYSTGAITLAISPAMTVAGSSVKATYQYETSFLFQSLLLIPYYGRMLALNTWEGSTAGTAVNFFNRCRFSQVGNPLERQAWVSTIFGRGGFIDAPTNETIVSARFYKNTLIVFFERSTWNLRYVGEYGLPFIWERISSDFGSESTFSTVLFDKGILAVSDKAIVSSSGSNVERIDLDIPDTVFTFQNVEEGKKRVQVARDFQKEIVYWNYCEPVNDGTSRVFPNRTLIYNYRNNTWAALRDSVTTFGTLQNASGDSWDLKISWDSATSWDTFYQGEMPLIVSGNQQGFIHYYHFVLDPETTGDSTSSFIEHESLFIKGITRSATAALSLEIPEHNFENEEIIYISGMVFLDTATSTVLTTTLNNKFYIVQDVTDKDNIIIYEWDISLKDYVITSGDQIGFTPATGTGTYIGCGVVTLLPKLDIMTKDFNPYQEQAMKMKSSYIDFQTDATPGGQVTINEYVNSSLSEVANLQVYNPDLVISTNLEGSITAITLDDPCQITSPNHGLMTGRQITIANVNGTIELNGGLYTITFVDVNNFTLDGVDSSAFTAYTYGGNWSSQDLNPPYIPGSNYAWNRFYSNVFGQYVTYQITYSDELMNNPVTHQSAFEMNAMMLHTKPSGRFP